MPMTPEEKELARQYRKQVYREQKDLLDKIKLDAKLTRRAEKEKALWALIKKADDLEVVHDESASDPQ